MIKLTQEHINVQQIIDSVYSNNAGAVDVFIGTVRNNTKGKNVVKLDFEAYEPMALKELKMIAKEAKEKWPVEKLSIVHAIGVREIGELAVVIAVSTPHRKASFEACQFCIDTLKQTVPIWKKEVFEDGEVWVDSTP
ncbi:MAG: molybdenum cofactor biosynthesis protein MoaE [Bacteroidota bacterium]